MKTTKRKEAAEKGCAAISRIGSGVIVIERGQSGAAIIHYDNELAAYAGGGGYDRAAAAMSEYLAPLIPYAILPDGAAGMDALQQELKAYGWSLEWASSPSYRLTVYTIRRCTPGWWVWVEQGAGQPAIIRVRTRTAVHYERTLPDGTDTREAARAVTKAVSDHLKRGGTLDTYK